MSDKSTPEWQTFTTRIGHAIQHDLISPEQYWSLRQCPPETPDLAFERFVNFMAAHDSHKIMRDELAEKRASRRSWWITVAIALLSALVVGMAVYLSRKTT